MWTWGRGKNLLRKGSFPLPQTPSPFSKPFIGIYLFDLQKDKCPSSLGNFFIRSAPDTDRSIKAKLLPFVRDTFKNLKGIFSF